MIDAKHVPTPMLTTHDPLTASSGDVLVEPKDYSCLGQFAIP